MDILTNVPKKKIKYLKNMFQNREIVITKILLYYSVTNFPILHLNKKSNRCIRHYTIYIQDKKKCSDYI